MMSHGNGQVHRHGRTAHTASRAEEHGQARPRPTPSGRNRAGSIGESSQMVGLIEQGTNEG